MSVKPIVLRERAHLDIDEAVEHYLVEAGPAIALDLLDALEVILHQISEQPASGSPRYALELGIPRLRFWPTGNFPYLVFYVENEVEVEVWRVLHGSRDIPAWVRELREA